MHKKTLTQIVKSPSNSSFSVADASERIVKGFVSVATRDRKRDRVTPDAFRIDRFMSAPTMMINHRYWKDENGNDVGVGKPTSMVAAKLLPMSDKPDEWAIYDIKKNSVVNTYPKSKVPDLKEGDEGVFISSKVTRDDVWKMINDGELSAFSWRGLVKAHQEVAEDGGIDRVITDVDLYEISFVHVPMHQSSTFVVGKSEELKLDDYGVYQIKLSKSRFDTKEKVDEYLKIHAIDCTKSAEDDENYTFVQHPSEMFQLNELVLLKMCEGVQFVAGPLKMRSGDSGWFGESLTEIQVDQLLSIEKSAKDSEENLMGDEKDKVEEKKDEKKEETTEVSKSANAEIASLTANAVITGLKPVFDEMTTGFKSMGDGFTQLVEKMLPLMEKQDEKKETEKKEVVEEVVSKSAIEEVKNDLGKMASHIAGLTKNFDKLLKAPAKPVEREEVVEVAKSADGKVDRGELMKNLFPF